VGKCQLRDMEGIKRHWYLVLAAHSVLRLDVSEGVLAEVVSRKSVANKAKVACFDMLSRFVCWVLEKNENSMGILKMVMGYK